jgi:hypothetical protein
MIKGCEFLVYNLYVVGGMGKKGKVRVGVRCEPLTRGELGDKCDGLALARSMVWASKPA